MATTGEMLKNGSQLAASSLVTKQHFFVYVGSTGVALTGANGAAHGILLNMPASGEPCELCGLGWGKITLGGSVTKGDFVKSDAAGKAVTASAADRIAGYVLGYVTAGGSAGDLVQMFFQPNATSTSMVETLTGAGAITGSIPVTVWIATSDNATMTDGPYVGFRKTVRLGVGTTGSNVLTPDDVTADTVGGTTPATFTATDPGQEIEFEWTSTGWKCVRVQQAGVATVAAAGTANPLIAKNDLATDGTDVATVASGIYPGQLAYFTVVSVANTPIQTISGLFYDEDGSADGITVNFVATAIAVGNMFLGRWNGARWTMINHVNATITT